MTHRGDGGSHSSPVDDEKVAGSLVRVHGPNVDLHGRERVIDEAGDGSGSCMMLVKTHDSDTRVYSHLLGK